MQVRQRAKVVSNLWSLDPQALRLAGRGYTPEQRDSVLSHTLLFLMLPVNEGTREIPDSWSTAEG